MDTGYKNAHIEKYAAEQFLCRLKSSLTNLYIASENKQHSTDPSFKYVAIENALYHDRKVDMGVFSSEV